jgi:tetratricopeptide (TPR) repeat protein
VSLAKQQQYELAIEKFEDSVRLLKDDREEFRTYRINVYINMAMIYEQIKDLDQSLDYLNMAYKCDPQNQKVLILKNRLEQMLIGIESGLIDEKQVYNI